MAFGIIHHFPGGTEKQYDATLRAVHVSDTELPEGQIFHAAGPSGDGWTVVAIHDSEASWNEFRDQVLMPGLQAEWREALPRRRRNRPWRCTSSSGSTPQ